MPDMPFEQELQEKIDNTIKNLAELDPNADKEYYKKRREEIVAAMEEDWGSWKSLKKGQVGTLFKAPRWAEDPHADLGKLIAWFLMMILGALTMPGLYLVDKAVFKKLHDNAKAAFHDLGVQKDLLNRVQSVYKQLKNERKELIAKKEKLETEISNLHPTNDAKKIAELNAQIDNLNEEILAKDKQITICKKAVETSREHVKKLADKRKDQLEKTANYSAKTNEIIAEKNSEIEELNKKIPELREKVRVNSEQVTKVEEELKAIKEQGGDETAKQKEMAALKTQGKELTTELSQLENKKYLAKRTIAAEHDPELKRAVALLEEDLDDDQPGIQLAQTDPIKLEDEVEALFQSSSPATAVSLADEVTHLEAEFKSAKAQYDSDAKAAEEVETRLKTLSKGSSEYDQAEKELEKASNKSSASYMKVTEIFSKLDAAKQKLVEAQSNKETLTPLFQATTATADKNRASRTASSTPEPSQPASPAKPRRN